MCLKFYGILILYDVKKYKILIKRYGAYTDMTSSKLLDLSRLNTISNFILAILI